MSFFAHSTFSCLYTITSHFQQKITRKSLWPEQRETTLLRWLNKHHRHIDVFLSLSYFQLSAGLFLLRVRVYPVQRNILKPSTGCVRVFVLNCKPQKELKKKHIFRLALRGFRRSYLLLRAKQSCKSKFSWYTSNRPYETQTPNEPNQFFLLNSVKIQEKSTSKK